MANEVYTIEQFNTLCAAIGQGVLIVEYGDKKVTYRSLNDMLRIKSLMETQLFPGQKKVSRTFISHKRGFN